MEPLPFVSARLYNTGHCGLVVHHFRAVLFHIVDVLFWKERENGEFWKLSGRGELRRARKIFPPSHSSFDSGTCAPW